jgi:intracellular sulfur oxidation DsrE/DsrF family protein
MYAHCHGGLHMRYLDKGVSAMLMLATFSTYAADAPAPVPPLIAGALPYVPIAGAVAAPDKGRAYKVIFDVTRAAEQPGRPVDGVLFAATDLSALRGQGVPERNTKFALIFHGPAVDGLLDHAAYRAKFGMDNPNLEMLAALKRAGVEVMACGQYLGAMKIDPSTLSRDVSIAAEAYLTLITYQNNGYALLEF